MISIDKYAYGSKLKNVSPFQKIVFSLLTMGVCLWAEHPVISVTVILIMGGITVVKGGIPFRFFFKILFIPMSFLLISVITIMVNVTDAPGGLLAAVPIFHQWVGFSYSGLQQGLQLFLKAMGAVSCLYFLSLNTPMVDLLAALRRMGIPKLLIEMMGLVYRFVFVLLETSESIFNAQSCRLGYSEFITAYRSLGALASVLFIRSYKRSDALYTSLEARGYDGELNVLEETYRSHWSGYAYAVTFNILLVFTAFILKWPIGGWH